MLLASCTRQDGENTDPSVTEATLPVTEATTDDMTAQETTDELTQEPTAPETTPPPAPETAEVFVHGYGGHTERYAVEIGRSVSSAALEAAMLPPYKEDVQAFLRGWEYSLEEHGERIPYDAEYPVAVSEKGMHLYQVIEYSFRVSFLPGEGEFPAGTETEFFVKSGKSISASELLGSMPEKKADAENRYSLLGFVFGGKGYASHEAFTVSGPIEFVAAFKPEKLIYNVIAHTEHGTLVGGGRTQMFSGTYAEAEEFVASYDKYGFIDIIEGNVLYTFGGIDLKKDGTEWMLELIWHSEVISHTITLDRADGSAPTKVGVEIGEKFTLPICEEREDMIRTYVFVGWRDPEGHLYNGGYELTVDGDMSFKAEFADGEKKVYTVTFKTDIGLFGGNAAEVILTGHYGDPLIPPEPPASETLTFGEVVYEFAGWNKEVGAVISGNALFTAVYTTPKPVFFANYYVDGRLYLSVRHYAESALTAPERPDFTKGKIFSGWFDLPERMPARDIDIHAVSRNAEVVYLLDGEVISRNETVVGTLVTLAAPAQKYGHSVSGWITTDISELLGTSFIMPERDVFFNAESAPNPHTVTYILDGVAVYADRVYYGELYTMRGIEVKRGYEFTRWSAQDASIDPEISTFAVPDADIVFVGSFTICSYKVNYYLDGELIYSDTYKYGDDVILRPDEVQDGCTFAWSSAGANISSGGFKMPAADVDIYGNFSDGENSIIFEIDGEMYGILGVADGKLVDLSTEPTKVGYTFSGWQSDIVDVSSGSFIMPEGKVILRGSFIPNMYTVSFIDIVSGDILSQDSLDFGARFVIDKTVYCTEGKICGDFALIAGDALRDGEEYIMPAEDVIFGIIWEDCLTIEISEGYHIPYFVLLYEEYPGCRYDETTKTLYISDPAIKVGGVSEDITVVFE